ncbi:hypothetical protein F4778DRAFT_771816 [Xylariomycetidae sp. FL2044]|nr:hypothetical protein F4778DRAFT_771816 [Xylariomycetidae sp. FL2044]
MVDLSDAEYLLYSAPFSLYSMMARHTAVLGPTTSDARPPKTISLELVNNKANDNLKEDYLRVNPKGQVPAMAGNVLDQPLTDSISISLYLAEKHYPAMLPAEHATAIRDLLGRIHAVPGPAFSNKSPTAEMRQHVPSPAEKILLQGKDLSPEYRRALEAKVTFHNNNYGKAFQPAVMSTAFADLRAIFAEVVEHRRGTSGAGAAAADPGEWTFGARVGPTVLDSHLLPLVLRCLDAGNAELVPPELRHWAEIRKRGDSWEKVMHGRPTQWDPSMGPVADMREMMTL